MREIRMLRSTRRGLETWHGRDGVTLATERASQQGTQSKIGADAWFSFRGAEGAQASGDPPISTVKSPFFSSVW